MPTITSRPLHNTDQKLESELLLLLLPRLQDSLLQIVLFGLAKNLLFLQQVVKQDFYQDF